MTQAELLLIVLSAVTGVCGYLLLLYQYRLRRLNYKQQEIPAFAGISFLISGTMIYGAEWHAQGLACGTAAAYLLVVLAFGLLGVADDLYGDRTVGGFKGHFRLLRSGKVSTGVIKAVVGGASALAAGFLMSYPLWVHMLVAAALVALTANFMNLLDVRPGRSLFASLVAGGLLTVYLALTGNGNLGFLFYVALSAMLVLYPLDAWGLIMIGDTGANVFGALVGLSAAMWLPIYIQLLIITCLVMFHIWAEKNSFSKYIASNKALRTFDSKIGIR